MSSETGPGSVMNALSLMLTPQLGHSRGNFSPARGTSSAQAIWEVSWEQGLSVKSQHPDECRPLHVRQRQPPEASRLVTASDETAGRSLRCDAQTPFFAMPLLRRRRGELRQPSAI